MKRIASVFISALMLITTGAAHAGLITQTDTLELNVALKGSDTSASTHLYDHRLTSFIEFGPAVDTLVSAELVLSFTGTGQNINVLIQNETVYTGSSSNPVTISNFDLTSFLENELLRVTVTKTQGGGQSTVTHIRSALTLAWRSGSSNGNGDNGNGGNGQPTPVPEPGTLVLMAAALLALASLRRRRHSA